jgi:hypothetical protein
MNIKDLNNVKEEIVETKFKDIPIKIKKRISLIDKIIVAKSIRDFCFADVVESNSDVTSHDFKSILHVYFFVKSYSDFDFEENNDYHNIANILITSGLYEFVYSQVSTNDKIQFQNEIERVFEDKYRQITYEQSAENLIAKLIEWIKAKVPDKEELDKMLKDLPNIVNSFDPNKLKFIQDALKVLK